MDKEKILERFQKENLLGDERKQWIDLKANSLAFIFATIAFLILFIAARMKGEPATEATFLYLALLVGQWLYKYISQRTTMKTAERAIYLLLLLGGSILLIGNFVELVK